MPDNLKEGVLKPDELEPQVGQPLSDLSAVHLAVSRLTTSSGKGSYRLRSWRPLEQSGSKESQDRIAPALFPGRDGVAFSHMPSFASSGRCCPGSARSR